MSGFFNVLSACSFILSIAACFFAARTATRTQELQDQLARLPLSRLQSLEASMTEQADALLTLANKMKMQKVRGAADHVRPRGELPDPYTDPDGWRKAMNTKLGLGKLGASSHQKD